MGKKKTKTITTAPLSPEAMVLLECDDVGEFMAKLETFSPGQLRASAIDLAFALNHVRRSLDPYGILISLRKPGELELSLRLAGA